MSETIFPVDDLDNWWVRDGSVNYHKIRATASALRRRLIRDARNVLLPDPDKFMRIHGKGIRTKFLSVRSGRTLIAKGLVAGEVWVTDGGIAFGPLTGVVPGNSLNLNGAPDMTKIGVFDKPQGIVQVVGASGMKALLSDGGDYGIDLVYLEMALQWLNVEEGSARLRKQEAGGTIMQREIDSDVAPLVLSADNGRRAVIAPTRL
jgi:hypothetical protein